MTRRVKQLIKDDIALIVAAFPNPAQQTAVIEAYLRTAGSILKEVP